MATTSYIKLKRVAGTRICKDRKPSMAHGNDGSPSLHRHRLYKPSRGSDSGYHRRKIGAGEGSKRPILSLIPTESPAQVLLITPDCIAISNDYTDMWNTVHEVCEEARKRIILRRRRQRVFKSQLQLMERIGSSQSKTGSAHNLNPAISDKTNLDLNIQSSSSPTLTGISYTVDYSPSQSKASSFRDDRGATAREKGCLLTSCVNEKPNTTLVGAHALPVRRLVPPDKIDVTMLKEDCSVYHSGHENLSPTETRKSKFQDHIPFDSGALNIVDKNNTQHQTFIGAGVKVTDGCPNKGLAHSSPPHTEHKHVSESFSKNSSDMCNEKAHDVLNETSGYSRHTLCDRDREKVLPSPQLPAEEYYETETRILYHGHNLEGKSETSPIGLNRQKCLQLHKEMCSVGVQTDLSLIGVADAVDIAAALVKCCIPFQSVSSTDPNYCMDRNKDYLDASLSVVAQVPRPSVVAEGSTSSGTMTPHDTSIDQKTSSVCSAKPLQDEDPSLVGHLRSSLLISPLTIGSSDPHCNEQITSTRSSQERASKFFEAYKQMTSWPLTDDCDDAKTTESEIHDTENDRKTVYWEFDFDEKKTVFDSDPFTFGGSRWRLTFQKNMSTGNCVSYGLMISHISRQCGSKRVVIQCEFRLHCALRPPYIPTLTNGDSKNCYAFSDSTPSSTGYQHFIGSDVMRYVKNKKLTISVELSRHPGLVADIEQLCDREFSF